MGKVKNYKGMCEINNIVIDEHCFGGPIGRASEQRRKPETTEMTGNRKIKVKTREAPKLRGVIKPRLWKPQCITTSKISTWQVGHISPSE